MLRNLVYKFSHNILKSKGQFLALEYLRRGTKGEPFNWSGVPIFTTVEQEELLVNKQFLPNLISYGKLLNNRAEKSLKNLDYLQRIIYLEQKQRLAELLLMRVDKITMAHSLEARVPFLDYRLLEFTSSLKPELKLSHNISKYLLKESVEEILPDNIINRKKQGFAAPVDTWFSSSWHTYAKNEIMNGYFVKNGFIDKDYLNSLFLRAKNPNLKLGSSIYALLNLTLWHKRFF